MVFRLPAGPFIQRFGIFVTCAELLLQVFQFMADIQQKLHLNILIEKYVLHDFLNLL